MEVKKIVEGMTAPQVAQVIHDNFDAVNNEFTTTKEETDAKLTELQSKVGIASYTQGSVWSDNGILTFVPADTRIYAVVKGSVHVELNEGYRVHSIYKGILGGSCDPISLSESNDVIAEPDDNIYIVFTKLDTTQTIDASIDVPATIKCSMTFADYEHSLRLNELESTPSLYVFNVNAYNNKLQSEVYTSVAEARQAVPSKYRRYGQKITYRLSSGWVTEQFVGIYIDPDNTAWIDEANQRWIRTDNAKQGAISYLVYDTDTPTTRLSVRYSERRPNKIICYHNGEEFVVERYTYSDTGDAFWVNNSYWDRMNGYMTNIYNTQAVNNELANLIDQSYIPTSNIINPLRNIYNPILLAVSSTYVAVEGNVTFVVGKDVPIGKTVSFALIYGDLTNESLAELGITQLRLGISENYPKEGESVRTVVAAGSPGLRERIVNEDLQSNYIVVAFATQKTGKEAIQIAINALQYLVVEIQDSYNPIKVYQPPYLFNPDIKAIGGATKEDIEALKNQIDSIEGIDPIVDILNSVKVVPNTIIPLGQNILSDNYSYDSQYWEVTDGVITYKGEGMGTAFTFQTPTENGSRYYVKITCFRSDGAYEDLFMTKLGNSDLVDVYNGSPNTNGGYISDGGYFAIVAFSNSRQFEIRNVELFPIVSEENASEIIELKTDNVHAGNSEATNINGKWNTAVGPQDTTMTKNVNGSRSIAIGFNALRNWNGGLQNIAIGTFALHLIEYGDRNVAIGSDCLWQVKRAFDNVCMGKGALGKTGEYGEVLRNIAIGTHAIGNALPNVEGNIAIGYNALKHGGKKNVSIGNETAGYVQGENNVAIGNMAYYGSYSTGDNNVAIGANSTIRDSQQDTGINYGVAIGSGAVAGHNSIAIGASAVCDKRYQTVIGKSSTIETKVFGDFIVQGTDGVKRKVIFQPDGTCGWEIVE